MNPRPRRGDEHGSSTAELVLLTPLLILFVLLIIGLGRLAHARALVTDAAASAARAATLAYQNPAAATSAAQQTATTALTDAGLSCTQATTTLDTARERPGGSITATLTCRIDLHDVITAGFPGSITLTHSYTAPIDPFVPGHGGAP